MSASLPFSINNKCFKIHTALIIFNYWIINDVEVGRLTTIMCWLNLDFNHANPWSVTTNPTLLIHQFPTTLTDKKLLVIVQRLKLQVFLLHIDCSRDILTIVPFTASTERCLETGCIILIN